MNFATISKSFQHEMLKQSSHILLETTSEHQDAIKIFVEAGFWPSRLSVRWWNAVLMSSSDFDDQAVIISACILSCNSLRKLKENEETVTI